MHAPRFAPLAALVVAAASWGLASCGTKFGLRGFGPVTLLAVALVPATVGLWAWLLVRGPRGTRPGRGRMVALGVLEPALAYLAITVGLEHTSAANSVVIEGLESAFVVALAALVLGSASRCGLPSPSGWVWPAWPSWNRPRASPSCVRATCWCCAGCWLRPVTPSWPVGWPPTSTRCC